MKVLKSALTILSVIVLFIGYSYYNYNKRSKAIDAVKAYQEKNHLVQVWHLRESHFNIFDKVLEDKSQFQFLFVNPMAMDITNNQNYWIQCSQWLDGRKLETLTNFQVKRIESSFEITTYDPFGSPIEYDTLQINEIQGKIFEIIDNWVTEYSKKHITEEN